MVIPLKFSFRIVNQTVPWEICLDSYFTLSDGLRWNRNSKYPFFITMNDWWLHKCYGDISREYLQLVWQINHDFVVTKRQNVLFGTRVVTAALPYETKGGRNLSWPKRKGGRISCRQVLYPLNWANHYKFEGLMPLTNFWNVLLSFLFKIVLHTAQNIFFWNLSDLDVLAYQNHNRKNWNQTLRGVRV